MVSTYSDSSELTWPVVLKIVSPDDDRRTPPRYSPGNDNMSILCEAAIPLLEEAKALSARSSPELAFRSSPTPLSGAPGSLSASPSFGQGIDISVAGSIGLLPIAHTPCRPSILRKRNTPGVARKLDMNTAVKSEGDSPSRINPAAASPNFFATEEARMLMAHKALSGHSDDSNNALVLMAAGSGPSKKQKTDGMHLKGGLSGLQDLHRRGDAAGALKKGALRLIRGDSKSRGALMKKAIRKPKLALLTNRKPSNQAPKVVPVNGEPKVEGNVPAEGVGMKDGIQIVMLPCNREVPGFSQAPVDGSAEQQQNDPNLAEKLHAYEVFSTRKRMTEFDRFVNDSKRMLSSHADQLASVTAELVQAASMLRELIDSQEKVSGLEREAWLLKEQDKVEPVGGSQETSTSTAPSSPISLHSNPDMNSLVSKFLQENIKRRSAIIPIVSSTQEQLKHELEAKRRILLQLRDSLLCK